MDNINKINKINKIKMNMDYNNANSSENVLISYIIITYNRNKELLQCIKSIQNKAFFKDFEIILVDNTPSQNAKEIADMYKNIRYFSEKKNLGVAGGRNLGIKESKGKYLIFIDDDAEVDTQHFDKLILNEFEKDKLLGITAFKILNYYTRQPNKGELPFKWKLKERLKNTKTYVSYYVGAGHAIRKSILKQTGIYDNSFKYGAEELYLSYKVLNAGYRILYLPDIVILHKKSTFRLPGCETVMLSIRNKIITAVKFLPFPYIYTYLFVWILRYLLTSFRNKTLKCYLKGITNAVQYINGRSFMRTCIKKETVHYLKKHYGRLWY